MRCAMLIASVAVASVAAHATPSAKEDINAKCAACRTMTDTQTRCIYKGSDKVTPNEQAACLCRGAFQGEWLACRRCIKDTRYQSVELDTYVSLFNKKVENFCSGTPAGYFEDVFAAGGAAAVEADEANSAVPVADRGREPWSADGADRADGEAISGFVGAGDANATAADGSGTQGSPSTDNDSALAGGISGSITTSGRTNITSSEGSSPDSNSSSGASSSPSSHPLTSAASAAAALGSAAALLVGFAAAISM